MSGPGKPLDPRWDEPPWDRPESWHAYVSVFENGKLVTHDCGNFKVKDDESALVYLDEYGRPSVHVMPSCEARED